MLKSVLSLILTAGLALAVYSCSSDDDSSVASDSDVKVTGLPALAVDFRTVVQDERIKMEGININYDGAASGAVPFMYVAMSDVTNAMTDGAGDIPIEKNRCGTVYRFGLDANFNTSRMDPVVAGGPYDSEAAANSWSTDNIVVMDDGRMPTTCCGCTTPLANNR